MAEVANFIGIPDAEFPARRAALSAALLAQDIDAWIAFGDDGAVAGPSHIRYLTDIEPHFEPVLLLRRADGAELLITGPETFGYAAVIRRRGLDTAIASMLLGHPSEEYPTSDLVDGVEAIAGFLKGARSVGLLGWERVPFGLGQELAGVLGRDGRRVMNGDAIAFSLRAIKTAAEQAVIDEAYRIACAGLLAAAGAIRPGVTERAVAAAAEAAMRREGAEGFGIDTMVASGLHNTQPIIARSTHRVIQPDDLVAVTVAPRYEGYHGALGRPFLLRPAPDLERIVEVARTAQQRCFETLAVGRLGWEAEAVARATVAQGKTGAEFPYVGIHSIGVVEFEPPIFASHSAEVVQPGMALSIDIPLYHAPWGGFRIEDGFAVESDALRPRIADHGTLVPLIL
jgi:Xaa-Pro aminopeptidase